MTITVARDGAPVNLTGASLRFVVLREEDDADADAAFEKEIGSGVVVTNAATGAATVVISANDIAAFDPYTLLFYRLILNTGAGDELIDTGTVRVVREVAEQLYISVEEVRAAGLGASLPEDAILGAIRTWQSFIERACRQWFYPRELEFFFDAPNSTILHFGVPVISIHSLTLHGSAQPLDQSLYLIEGDGSASDGRHNPCIRLLNEGSRSIYATPYRPPFFLGRARHFIRGVFGYVEPNGGPPPLIQRALLKLVIEKLAKPVYPQPGVFIAPPPLMQGVLREEWTDDHRMKFDPSGGPLKSRAPGLAGITDDPEVLGILRLYRAPIGIASLTVGGMRKGF